MLINEHRLIIFINTKTRTLNIKQILWRPNPVSKLKVFQLRTVTYQTTSAPWLAEIF